MSSRDERQRGQRSENRQKSVRKVQYKGDSDERIEKELGLIFVGHIITIIHKN